MILKKGWHSINLQDLKFGLKKGYTFQLIQKKFLPFFSIKEIKQKAKEYGWKIKQQKWIEKEFQLIQRGTQEGLSIEEICQYYLPNRTVVAIQHQIKLKKWKSPKKWVKKELFTLDYSFNVQNLTLVQIQKQFFPNRSLLELQTRVTLPNWNVSLYDSHLPFDANNIQLAFVAGFILADGSFTKSLGIQFGLSIVDKNILEWICDVLKLPHSNIKITKNPKLISLYLNTTLGYLFIKYFQLSRNKSQGQVIFPKFLNPQCLKAFLLGLWYGDGSYSPSVKLVRFMSSMNFLNKLLCYAHKNGYCLNYTSGNIKKIPTKTPNFDIANLQLSGRSGLLFFRYLAEPRILKLLPCLKRKIKDALTCTLPKQINRYTKKEDNLLIKLSKSSQIQSYKQIYPFFRQRSPSSIKHRMKKLNLSRYLKKQGVKWSSYENKKLMNLLQRKNPLNYRKIMAHFPTRRYSSVYHQIKRLKP